MLKIKQSKKTPIANYLRHGINLHHFWNQETSQSKEQAEKLNGLYTSHFANPLHTNTQALLAHQGLAVSAHDGFIEMITERRIAGTNRIRAEMLVSVYVYDAQEKREVGCGEMTLVFEGTERIRALGNFQNSRVVDMVIDQESKRVGFTLVPHLGRTVVVEFGFDTMQVASMKMTSNYEPCSASPEVIADVFAPENSLGM